MKLEEVDTGFEIQKFDKQFVYEVFKRDNFRCQKCGSTNNLHPAHIEHRKLGGDDTKNYKRNVVTLCGDCHEEFDNELFSITKWNPEDKEDGLRIVWATAKEIDGKMRNAVPKEQLYFYNRPSQKGAEIAQTLHKQALQQIKVANQATYSLARTLEMLRDKEVDGKPLYKHREKPDSVETYNKFANYLGQEIIPRVHWNSSKTAENFTSAMKALKPSANDVVGVYLAFEGDEIDQSVVGKEVTGKRSGNSGVVEEVYEQPDKNIARVVDVGDKWEEIEGMEDIEIESTWKDFDEGEEVEFEGGKTATTSQVRCELQDVLTGNYSDLASVINNNDLTKDEKIRLLELAKDDQEEFRKEKRALTGDTDKSNRLTICTHCTYPSSAPSKELEAKDGTIIKLGSEDEWCDICGKLISSMNTQEAKNTAQKHDKKENCFDPD